MSEDLSSIHLHRCFVALQCLAILRVDQDTVAVGTPQGAVPELAHGGVGAYQRFCGRGEIGFIACGAGCVWKTVRDNLPNAKILGCGRWCYGKQKHNGQGSTERQGSFRISILGVAQVVSETSKTRQTSRSYVRDRA